MAKLVLAASRAGSNSSTLIQRFAEVTNLPVVSYCCGVVSLSSVENSGGQAILASVDEFASYCLLGLSPKAYRASDCRKPLLPEEQCCLLSQQEISQADYRSLRPYWEPPCQLSGDSYSWSELSVPGRTSRASFSPRLTHRVRERANKSLSPGLGII